MTRTRSAPYLVLAACLLLVCSACEREGRAAGDAAGSTAEITYRSHEVLALETVVDVDGSPDIADPHVIKVDGSWYLYATQTKRDLQVWISDDLATWRLGDTVWSPTAGSWNEPGQVWAPHVEAGDDGRYYLYYTAHFQIGVAAADTPLGPFKEVYDHPLVGGGFGGVGDGVFDYEPGPDGHNIARELLTDFEEYAIDAFVLRAGDGSMTIYFSAYSPVSELFGLPMLDYTILAEIAPTKLTTPNLSGWEGFVNEGAWVIEGEGRFHLMYSGNGADTARYAIGVATGSSPLGPFEKREDNPILKRHDDLGFFGPGHHSVVEGAFEDLLVFFHTKVSDQKEFNRRIRYAPMSFDEEGSIRIEQP